MKLMDLTGCVPDEITDAIEQTHALECAVRAQQLQFVAFYVAEELWKSDASSMAEWLRHKFSMDAHLAADFVRVAEVIQGLPKIFDAFSVGQISWDQITVATKFLTPDMDEEWVELLRKSTLGQVREAARLRKPPTPKDAEEAHETRRLSKYWSRDGNTFYLNGRWGADAGTIIENAINAAAERAVPQMEDPAHLPRHHLDADAMVELAAVYLGSSAEAAKPSLIVHIDAAILAKGGEGVAEIENGSSIDATVARRLACDGKIQLVFDGRDGKPVGIGRQAHDPPWWLARRIRKRDKGCRFPTCERKRWINLHHIEEWVKDLGPTDDDNVISLCYTHHHLLHEGGWRLRGNPNEDIEFIDTHGNVFIGYLPTLRADVQQRFEKLLG